MQLRTRWPADPPDLDIAPFRPRVPWFGADLQTLRNLIARPANPLAAIAEERVKLPLADGSGDVLVGALQRPPSPTTRPLAVLIHGLSGSEESAYMLASAAALLARGHPVLRLNLRGAGPSRPLCRWQYHAGRSEDLRDALVALEPEWTRHGLVLAGYSLGGNMLLKFAAEHARALPVLAVASVSAPIDLSAASQRFLAPRNRVYHWNLLRNMKRESLAEGGHITPDERRAILSARSILEFDERFVGPRNGYQGAEDYYADNMARRFLAHIPVPALVIHSLDDPWIPPHPYTSYPWHEHPQLVPLLTPGGGHVGFHARDGRETWHDRVIARFFAAVAEPAS